MLKTFEDGGRTMLVRTGKCCSAMPVHAAEIGRIVPLRAAGGISTTLLQLSKTSPRGAGAC